MVAREARQTHSASTRREMHGCASHDSEAVEETTACVKVWHALGCEACGQCTAFCQPHGGWVGYPCDRGWRWGTCASVV